MNLLSPYKNNSLIIENPSSIGSVKYTALGDSLTAGVGSETVNDTFVYQYALNISEKYKTSVEILNLAQPGGTTVDVINYQLAQTIDSKPHYITLLIGTNDMHNKVSLKKFKENYLYILNTLLNNTDAKITVINIPYLGSSKSVFVPFNYILNFRTKQYNQTLFKLVGTLQDKNRIKLIDLYSGTYKLSKNNSDYYASDQFHPSGKGYTLWGQFINAN